MALKVLGARVMIKVDEAETTQGGIVLPETAREKPQWGTVVSVGEYRLADGTTRPLDVQVGDRVVFAKYGGREVRDGGQEYLILEADQVYAKEVPEACCGCGSSSAKSQATKEKK